MFSPEFPSHKLRQRRKLVLHKKMKKATFGEQFRSETDTKLLWMQQGLCVAYKSLGSPVAGQLGWVSAVGGSTFFEDVEPKY